jgi:hypothetical protein
MAQRKKPEVQYLIALNALWRPTSRSATVIAFAVTFHGQIDMNHIMHEQTRLRCFYGYFSFFLTFYNMLKTSAYFNFVNGQVDYYLGRRGVLMWILVYYARGRGFDSLTVQTFVSMNMSVCIGSECFYV